MPNSSTLEQRIQQQVYSPSWFHIKYHGKFTSSPSNLHYQMELVVNLAEEVQQTVKPVIQRNANLAEPSLLLGSMLENEDPALRQQKAVNKIYQIRANPPRPLRAGICKGIRKHVNPTSQWGSRDCWNIIDWDTARVDEPKILHKVTSQTCMLSCISLSFSGCRTCCEARRHLF